MKYLTIVPGIGLSIFVCCMFKIMFVDGPLLAAIWTIALVPLWVPLLVVFIASIVYSRKPDER